MKIISLREAPEYLKPLLRYVQSKWASAKTMTLYEGCFLHTLDNAKPLPQSYALYDGEESRADYQ